MPELGIFRRNGLAQDERGRATAGSKHVWYVRPVCDIGRGVYDIHSLRVPDKEAMMRLLENTSEGIAPNGSG
jgi:hypothetical protein